MASGCVASRAVAPLHWPCTVTLSSTQWQCGPNLRLRVHGLVRGPPTSSCPIGPGHSLVSFTFGPTPAVPLLWSHFNWAHLCVLTSRTCACLIIVHKYEPITLPNAVVRETPSPPCRLNPVSLFVKSPCCSLMHQMLHLT